MSNSPYDQVIWLGYDPKQAIAFAIAKYSIRRFDRYIPIRGLVLDFLRQEGFYWREIKTVVKSGMWEDREIKIVRLEDVLTGTPMSTEFSFSRFLVPSLAKRGWSLYADCDVIFRRNPNELFSMVDESKAVMVVKHDYQQEGGVKMDGQVQTVYPRKNWSSVMLFNCEHPSVKRLTPEYVNTHSGKDLHQFAWLEDDEIGELPPEWNYCVGHTKLNGRLPSLVHFTDGIPDMDGYENQEYADEWQALKVKAIGAL